MRCYRIADGRHPLFDPTGARLHGGRWNSPGGGVIYAAETYAGAVLEVLVHSNIGRVPTTHAVIAIEIPDELPVEKLEGAYLLGWHAPDMRVSREFGDRWLAESRTAVVMVPSLVTQGREHNLLLNPAHAEFGSLTYSAPEPVIWDERLFRR
jgi:RES domain-containing protein